VCVLATKKQQARRSFGTAGATIGCTFTRAESSMADSFAARSESPTITGITGVPVLARCRAPPRGTAGGSAPHAAAAQPAPGSAMSLRRRGQRRRGVGRRDPTL
jgi:hypothetical protein